MANRLNIPEDLEQLVEKREKERRQQENAEAEKSPSEDQTGRATSERRSGKGRREEDRT